jgi:hypothetical protein
VNFDGSSRQHQRQLSELKKLFPKYRARGFGRTYSAYEASIFLGLSPSSYQRIINLNKADRMAIGRSVEVSDFPKNDFLLLPTQFEQWHSDYNLFIASKFPLKDTNGNSLADRLIWTVFYDNALNEVKDHENIYNSLPASFLKSELFEAYNTLNEVLNAKFKKEIKRHPATKGIIANRKLMLTDTKSGTILFSSRLEISNMFWYFYFKDYEAYRKKTTAETNGNRPRIFSIIDFCRESNFDKDCISFTATKSMAFQKEKNNLTNCEEDRSKDHWNSSYDEKLKQMISDPNIRGTALTSFLNQRPKNLRPYMTYRALEICEELKSKANLEMYQNILNEKNFETKLKEMVRLLECFGPEEEQKFYSRLLAL